MEKNIGQIESDNLKRTLIPQEWKESIDDILKKDLLEANRYFAKTNPRISKVIEQEIVKTPELFYRNLCERWEWHNEFYEKFLEPALNLLVRENSSELSPLQVEMLIRVYETVSLVDQATLVMSAAIKKHLEIWASKEKLNSLNKEDRLKLINLPLESFWVQYHIDHLDYIIEKKRNVSKSISLKEELLCLPPFFRQRIANYARHFRPLKNRLVPAFDN